MADETQEQTPPTPESTEIDWAQFFSAEGTAEETPDPVAPAPVADAPALEESDDVDDVELLKKKLADLEQTVSKTQKTTDQIEYQTRLSTAMEAWKKQASPAELSMADVLAEARDLEDLKSRSALVKRMSQAQEQSREQMRKEVELEMQKQFGIPIPPTFNPVPEEEKVQKMLEDGDIDGAANALLKGVFNT